MIRINLLQVAACSHLTRLQDKSWYSVPQKRVATITKIIMQRRPTWVRYLGVQEKAGECGSSRSLKFNGSQGFSRKYLESHNNGPSQRTDEPAQYQLEKKK